MLEGCLAYASLSSDLHKSHASHSGTLYSTFQVVDTERAPLIKAHILESSHLKRPKKWGTLVSDLDWEHYIIENAHFTLQSLRWRLISAIRTGATKMWVMMLLDLPDLMSVVVQGSENNECLYRR